MIKATKKELEKALEIACLEVWADELPGCKCDICSICTIDECIKCWKEHYIKLAKEEGTKEL